MATTKSAKVNHLLPSMVGVPRSKHLNEKRVGGRAQLLNDKATETEITVFANIKNIQMHVLNFENYTKN